jgi:hypothetical protein
MDCQNLRMGATFSSGRSVTAYRWHFLTSQSIYSYFLLLCVFYILVWWETHLLALSMFERFIACAVVFCFQTQYTRSVLVVRIVRRFSYILDRLFFRWRNSPTRVKAAFLLRFLHHTRLDTHTTLNSSGGMGISSQRPLPTQHTTNTRDGHAYPQLDANPQYQQQSGF